MARHRNVRNRNYSDDYDYDDVYGHSVEEDSCLSPTDSAQWMFDRSRNEQVISHFLDSDNNFQQELNEEPAVSQTRRRSSIDLQSLNLRETDEVRLLSCLDELRNILGDSVPDNALIKFIIKHDFDYNKALDNILNSNKTNGDVAKPSQSTSDLPLKVSTADLSSYTPETADESVKVVPVKGLKIKSDVISNSRPQTPRGPSPSVNKTSEESKPVFKAKDNKIDPDAQYTQERGDEKQHLYIIVVGHVDAGKSTLMGRLLCEIGEVNQKTLHKYEQESKKLGKQSFMYAWVLDETGEERNRGITMDIGKASFETKSKKVIILDAPGHADFIPNMITGAGQADVALLVVDATRGEFESGFDLGGQTREHALLVRSLGITQLAVAVNKLDTSNWSKERFLEISNKLRTFLKQAGYKENDVTFVPCSGLTGENLIKSPNEPELVNWYKGPCLLEVIDNFSTPSRSVGKALRMSVSDIFKATGSGFCVAGRIETGVLNKGDKVLICPTKELSEVKSISINDLVRTAAFAGDQVIATLSGVDMQNISIGYILSDPTQPVPIASRFESRLVVFNVKTPITNGYPVLLHHQSLVESASIVKLKALLNKSTGEVLKKKPRCLGNNSVAIVDVEVCRPICVERYKDIKELGRVTLRVAGVTIAAGLITNIYN